MRNPSVQARLAAFLYMIVVGTSVFALYANTGVVVANDDAATAANLTAREPLLRLAFVSNLIASVAYVAVVALFYRLFKPVNASLSLVAGFVGLAGCAISAALMLNMLAPFYLLDVGAFSTEQTHALARHALRLGGLGNSVGLVFFGFYCLCLGALALGARFMPRFLGVLPIIAGIGWLVGNFARFIAPEMSAPLTGILLPVSGLGELLFALWLLVMGVNSEKWRAQASAAA